MKRTNLLLASAGGAAVLAVAGAALGVTAARDSRTDTTLAAATAAPTVDSTTAAPATGGPSSTGTASGTPTSGAPSSSDAPSAGGAPAGAAVDEKRAGEIALAKAGGGRIVEIEAEQEHGRAVWSVEVVVGDTEHEVDVDRENGSVVKAEQEPVDADDDADDKNDDADDDDGDDD
ncbi:PepSY domain-containing protein [Micromonospora sp. CA-246542]|uniref:PepSY domain-containing protein n=1 Tax=Micromonospora sp. CA-246542 TaxID=3239959 RepID=UPI003D8F80E2